MILLGLTIINYRNRRKTAVREALIHKQKKQLAENELKTKEVELMQMSTFIIEKMNYSIQSIRILNIIKIC